ncbi:tRNA pseudouridine(38-40) synthase TruA [Alicyclobacillaceae bacterium I2511]|nr:tRNA pseudouridine(38-40) synthase TruA [Alicyclobacillaceae bacterium I2511]
MTRIKLAVAYDGTQFHGFARQPGLRTVQGELESTLQRLLGIPVEVYGSGRTDAGVHARVQVVHWDQSFGPQASRYPFVLQRMLPKDIMPLRGETVDTSFHARFSATAKTYRYTLQRAAMEDIFTRRYSWHLPGRLDVTAMQQAAADLVGYHDFTSYCAAATPVEDKRRQLYEIRFEARDTYLDIYFRGNGYLQNMVRILTGTLVDWARGELKHSPAWVLAARDRRVAGQTAPAQGLALWQVEY